MLNGLLSVLLAYGLGCCNSAYYLLRWRDGRDIRDTGSANAGARNMGRLLGTGAFALVFVLDAGKGVLAVALATGLAPTWAPVAALAVTLGHVWPLQLQGCGGRGVATALGVLLALSPALLLGLAACFTGCSVFCHRATPAGIAAFWLTGLLAIWLAPPALAALTLLLAALLSFTHRSTARIEVTS